MATGDNQHTLTIMTANIGCGANPYVKGDRDKCKVALRKLVKRERPSLVFLQESNYQYIARSYRFPRKYSSAMKGEDRFLLDDTELKLKMIDSADVSKLRDQKFKEFESYLAVEYINMALVNILKNSKTEYDLLCVSWHGPHIKDGLNSERRMEILEVILRFVKFFGEKYDLPILIGGDFNLELAGAKKVMKSFNDMEVYDYDSGRRPKRVDYFLSSKSLTLIDVKVVPWNDKESDRILDHDAIIGKLLVNYSKDLLKPTKDEPNNTDCGMEDYFEDHDIQCKHKIKREDTANVKEESDKKLIKTHIAKEFMEELEEKINQTIEKYSKESSEETKKQLKKEIQEEFEEKIEEFKNK